MEPTKRSQSHLSTCDNSFHLDNSSSTELDVLAAAYVPDLNIRPASSYYQQVGRMRLHQARRHALTAQFDYTRGNGKHETASKSTLHRLGRDFSSFLGTSAANPSASIKRMRRFGVEDSILHSRVTVGLLTGDQGRNRKSETPRKREEGTRGHGRRYGRSEAPYHLNSSAGLPSRRLGHMHVWSKCGLGRKEADRHTCFQV